jgi:O-antigen/teichoic acid export membrane protein
MSGSVDVNQPARRLSLAELAGGGGLVFLVASATVGFSNFLFHVVVSRLLGPDRYGALGALLTLVLVLSVPLAALQAAVTRAVALRQGQPVALRQMLLKATVGSLAAMVLLVAFSPVIAGYLHLSSPVPVIVLATLIPPTALASVLQGMLIGKLRFTPVAIALVVGGAARLIFGAVLVEAGAGVTGAMLAGTIAAFVTLGIVAWPLHHEMTSSSRSLPRLMPMSDGLAALLAVGGYWVFAGADTFLVRHLMAAHPAGLYAAAATGSRIALFAPAAFVMLVFPRFAATRGRGQSARRLLLFSLALVTLMGVLVGGAIVELPGPLIRILFGKGFSGSAGTVGILAVEASVLGVIGLLTYFHLARGSIFAQLNWLGAAAAVVGVSLFHRSMTEVATVMLIASLVVLLFALAGVFLSRGSVEKLSFREEEKESNPDACELSIIIPFFNPGPRFGPHLNEVAEVLAASGRTFEVIAVSDGCTDGSQLAVGDLHVAGIRLISLSENRGKGTALRLGMAEARGTYVGFIDADGDLPARLIPNLVALTVDDRPDIVLGSKRHPDSDVVYPPLRRLYSLTYQALVGILFNLPVRDTQTGLKLIRRETLVAVVPRMVEKRFAFDLELLVVARHLGYRRFVEVPVVIGQRFTSTISLRAVRGMVIDTLAIFYRLRIVRSYDEAPDISLREQAGALTAPRSADGGLSREGETLGLGTGTGTSSDPSVLPQHIPSPAHAIARSSSR